MEVSHPADSNKWIQREWLRCGVTSRNGQGGGVIMKSESETW